MEPEHSGQRICHRYGVDVCELGVEPAAERRVFVEGEGELNVARSDIFAILPPRRWIDMERQHQ